MPAFTSLTDRQRWDVVAYLYDLSANPVSFAKGAAVFQENCSRCHGPDGAGKGPDARVDALGKMPDFTSQENMANKTADGFFQTISNGEIPAMPGFAETLSEEDRWALTDYLRSLTFAPATIARAAPATSIPGQEPSVPVTVPLTATTTVTETDGSGVVQGVIMNASGVRARRSAGAGRING